MVIIGVVLFLAAAAFGIDLAAKNRFRIPDLHVFGENIGLGGSARLYILGAITGAALMLSLVLLWVGLRRKGSKATARRQERKAAKDREGQLRSLQADNAKLRDELSERDSAGAADSSAEPRTASNP